MNRVLWVLAILAPAAVLAAGTVPMLAVPGVFLAVVATIAWAVLRGVRAWAFAIVPGAAIVFTRMPAEMGAYAAALLAGPCVAWALSRGRSPRTALAIGAAPFAMWTIVVAASGVNPIEAGSPAAFDRIIEEAGEAGRLSAQQVGDWQASSRAARQVLVRTWVATEVVSFWITLVLAYALVARMFPGLRGFGRLSALRVPDAVAWALIAGLVLVLLGRTTGPDLAQTMGWNLVFGAGFAFFLCGLGIERAWMERAGFRKFAQAAVFVGGVLFFFPLFLVTTSGLGLFDTWFDFRRLRAGEPGQRPFSPFPRSSNDDRSER